MADDGRGNVLVSFERGREDAPPEGAPTPLALIALWHGPRVLLVRDRFRDAWELPGGSRESGESPREAAVRELGEETGQRADERLLFIGWARFLLAPDGRSEHGALYGGLVARPRPFEPNGEIAAVHWWDPREPPPAPAQPLDLHLARLAAPRPARRHMPQ
ncbi:NUDIX hydrolase [Streptomyces sp. PT12]|nr:NUDIX hydrolase [Streptomyces sp. PT12]